MTLCKADSELLGLFCVESHVVGNCHWFISSTSFCRVHVAHAAVTTSKDGAIVNILTNRKRERQVVNHDQEEQGAKLGPLWYPGIDRFPPTFHLTKLDTLGPVLKKARTPVQ